MVYWGGMKKLVGLNAVLGAVLGGVIVVCVLGSCRSGGPVPEGGEERMVPAVQEGSSRPEKDSPAETLSLEEKLSENSRLWLLGVSAIFVELNGGNPRSMVPFEPTPEIRKEWQSILERSWGVTSRSSFYAKLKELEETGDSREYQRLLPAAENPQISYADLAQTGKYDRKALMRIRFLAELEQELPRANGLKGWDLARGMVLCRWACLSGSISRDEAWREMVRLGAAVGRRFSSWGELGANIALGRGFWRAPDGQPEEIYREVLALMGVLSGPGRLWSEVSWERGEKGFDGLETGGGLD